MSQVATARPATRPTGGTRPRTTPRELRVVTAPRAGHGGLILGCLLLLVGAFVAVLLLNISMAKSTFVLGDLQRQSSELTDTAADARHTLDRETAPAALAQRALALGMVPSGSAAFLRLSDGAVLGVAQAAPDASTFSVVAQAPAATGPRGSAAAAPPAAPPVPTTGTTVTHNGTVTRTTVVEIREGKVVTTVTSTDAATGITTSTTSTQDLPPGATASATPSPTPSPEAASPSPSAPQPPSASPSTPADASGAAPAAPTPTP